MAHEVALVVVNGTTQFEMAVAYEVFGIDRTDDGVPDRGEDG